MDWGQIDTILTWLAPPLLLIAIPYLIYRSYKDAFGGTANELIFKCWALQGPFENGQDSYDAWAHAMLLLADDDETVDFITKMLATHVEDFQTDPGHWNKIWINVLKETSSEDISHLRERGFEFDPSKLKAHRDALNP